MDQTQKLAAYKDALQKTYATQEELDSAATALDDYVSGGGTPQGDPVKEAVIEAVKTAGLVESFGEDALKSELEAKGWTVTKNDTPTE